ncbi:MAG: ribbon-helix-helix protein, CopG family [Actinomycetota bacterium]|jgi:predicted transcriptional regulator|nr:ribbon-helix-helix protein, CopG family [Actinomycetota bacterium]
MAGRTQTMVQLNEQLLGDLDRRAARDRISRSQLIRQAVEDYLAKDREAEIDRQIVEGYQRMPQGGENDIDEWGDLGLAVTALSIETFRRLDEEERAAGFEPW